MSILCQFAGFGARSSIPGRLFGLAGAIPGLTAVAIDFPADRGWGPPQQACNRADGVSCDKPSRNLFPLCQRKRSAIDIGAWLDASRPGQNALDRCVNCDRTAGRSVGAIRLFANAPTSGFLAFRANKSGTVFHLQHSSAYAVFSVLHPPVESAPNSRTTHRPHFSAPPFRPLPRSLRDNRVPLLPRTLRCRIFCSSMPAPRARAGGQYRNPLVELPSAAGRCEADLAGACRAHLPAFVDHRHTTGVYPMPERAMRNRCSMRCSRPSMSFLSPVYCFSVPVATQAVPRSVECLAACRVSTSGARRPAACGWWRPVAIMPGTADVR